MTHPKLAELRTQLDIIDDEIITLIAKRLKTVSQVDTLKKQENLPGYDPARWGAATEVRSKLAEAAQTDPRLIEAIFNLIHEHTLEHIYKMPHAYYIGPEGSFSHKAAGSAIDTSRYLLTPAASWTTLWHQVEEVEGAVAVVPVENSITSSVHANMDVLFEGKLSIVSEVFLNIELGLFAKPGSKRSAIKTIYSHPQALAQAAQKSKSLGLSTHETQSTSEALKIVAELDDETVAALAPLDSKKDGLVCVEEHFQDSTANQTRFLVVSAHQNREEVGTKASLLVTLKNEVGSLEAMLASFKNAGFDLTKIESRPIPSTPWSYRFWIDMLLPKSITAIELQNELKSDTIESVQILGVYTPGKVA